LIEDFEVALAHRFLEERLEQRRGLDLVVAHHAGEERRPRLDDRQVLVRIEPGLARHDAHAHVERAADRVDAERLALQVRGCLDPAVGANDGGIVVMAIESEGQQLMHDQDRHARLVDRIRHWKRRREAAVDLAGDERRHGVAAAGEANPFDFVRLAIILENVLLLLHEQVRTDRDVRPDADLDLLLRRRRAGDCERRAEAGGKGESASSQHGSSKCSRSG
jgi:hypothetical protein